jgi:hypothetical protein
MLMTVLVGATVLIIIAVAVFLFALRVLRRQVGQQRAMTGEPIGELMAVPAQEFFANPPSTVRSLTSDGVQYSSGSGLADLDREGQWTQTAHQFGSNQDNLVDYGAMVFATEPVPTEQMPQQATPRAPQLPSTPVPQQQPIPSTPTTPTDLWEMSAGEVVTDPVLETMMHEAQAGLYVIPEREDRLEA